MGGAAGRGWGLSARTPTCGWPHSSIQPLLTARAACPPPDPPFPSLPLQVSKLYADLRKESEISNGIPVAVRHVESVLRMTEASARMRLSPTVNEDDLNLAIQVMLESFINAQKFGVQRALRRQFTRYLDVGVDVNQLLLNNLRSLVREQQALSYVQTAGLRGIEAMPDDVDVSLGALEERAARHGITKPQVTAFFSSPLFQSAGFVLDAAARRIIHQLAA